MNELNARLEITDKKLSSLEEKIQILKKEKESSNQNSDKVSKHKIPSKLVEKTEKPQLKVEKNQNVDFYSSEKTQKETEIINTEVLASPRKQDSEMTSLWKESVNDLRNNNYNSAYNRLLKSSIYYLNYLDDDLYLLRLVFLTGPVLNFLTIENSKNLLSKVNLISRNHQIENLIFSLIQQSYDLSVFIYLREEHQNSLLDTLYEYSLLVETDIGEQSKELYNSITTKLSKA
jgi:hypothetical protein